MFETPSLSLTQAAAALGISASRARQILTLNPQICRKIGGRWCVSTDAVQAMLFARTKEKSDVPA